MPGQHLDNLHDLCESTLVGRKLDVDLRLSALALEDSADLVKQWPVDALFERVVDRCRELYGQTRWTDPTLELDEEYRHSASWVENWFRHRRGWDRERCRRQITHLAVELNQSSLELPVKETFVSLLFGEPSPELGDALDEYLSTADVVTRADVLLRKVQQLGDAA